MIMTTPQAQITASKVVFYWDQPFQPQPVRVDTIDVSQQNTFPTVFG